MMRLHGELPILGQRKARPNPEPLNMFMFSQSRKRRLPRVAGR